MSRTITEDQAVRHLERLKEIEWSLNNIEQHFALTLRAYENAMEDQMVPLRREALLLKTELEAFMRARQRMKLGQRWQCAAGTLLLKQGARWKLGMGDKKTAQKLLSLGYVQLLKLSVKLSALEQLSPELRAVLEISRDNGWSFSLQLKGGP